MRSFLLAFVPLFVAVDAVGVLPIFLALTDGMDRRQRRKIVLQSLITALAVAIGFIFLGQGAFRLLGIRTYDFLVAGGVLLFVLATLDLVLGTKAARDVGTMGAVPLGTPLIVGPAVLTTALMMVGQHGYAPTIAAVVANILLAGIILLSAGALTRLLGPAGNKAVSKVASLLLAAIAVMMVRKGILGILAELVASKPS